jgi:hypothetical protein
MINFNLDEESEKLIDLCETSIEIELFLKIINFVIKPSFFYNSDEELKCYKLTILRDINLDKTGGKKYSDMDLMDYKYLGIRIDYSGFYEKEFLRYIEILPQYKFLYKVEDENLGLPIIVKEFRLDFGVLLKDYKTDKIIKKFCIECDGFEYHSTQERIIRDNQRDRRLLDEGEIHTIRFLGKEINEMKNVDIDKLLDILFIEKNKEFDFNSIKGKDVKYITDEKGLIWKRPNK